MKNVMRMAAFGAILAVTGSTVPSVASTIGFAGVQDQMQHHDDDHNHDNARQNPDYSNNPYYNQGNQDGYGDYRDHAHRRHHHKFHNKADRQAYDYGYQQGLQGQQGYHGNGESH